MADPLAIRQPRRAAQTRTLLAGMASRSARWWITGGFERQDFLTKDGARWTVCYKIHLAPVTWPDVALASSITLWAPQGGKSARAADGRAWRASVVRRLRRFGYSGSWSKDQSGEPLGNFWKGHTNARAVLEEAEFLENLSNRRQLFPSERSRLATRPLR